MKKKICVLTTVHLWDDNRVYYKELQSLKALGYDVTYVISDQVNQVDKAIQLVTIPNLKGKFKRIFGFLKAYNVVKKTDCEIVHFHDPELLFTGFLLKWFTKKKVVYDVHEDYPAQMLTKYYIKAKWIRRALFHYMNYLERSAGKKFDAIITADSAVFSHFPAEKTTILYNYPSLSILSSVDEKIGEVEKKYDIIFPGSMARFTAQLFLDVLRKAKERGRVISCLLISPFQFNGGKQWLVDTAKEYGVYEQLTLMDRIPTYEVPFFMKSTRLGLIPLPDTLKMRSNIPTKMFEYMYYRLPVLTSDLPPCGQYMKKDFFGYLIKYDDVDNYVEKIIHLLDSPDLVEELGNTGRSLVVNSYNWEIEEMKLKNVYEKLFS